MGIILAICGLGVAFYFYGFFTTSVATPTHNYLGVPVSAGRISNSDLVRDKQKGILAGFCAALVGFGAVLAGSALTYRGHKTGHKAGHKTGRKTARRLKPDRRKCPFCAEHIKVEAKICRYCHSELEAELPVASSQQTAV